MIVDEVEPRSQRGVGTIEVTGRILRALVNADGPLKLRDLATTVEIGSSQIHPYLVSLRNIGLVEQIERGRYQLGPFALRLGLSRMKYQDAYREAIGRIRLLSDSLNQMVSISVWGTQGATVVYVERSGGDINAVINVGGIYDLTLTATGKVFAAYLSQDKIAPVLDVELGEPRTGRRRIFNVQRDEYLRAVAEVRETGFATTRDMPVPGVSAVAAPVFDHTGYLELCVAVSGYSDLIDLSPDGEVVKGLLEFTLGLSRDLGHAV